MRTSIIIFLSIIEKKKNLKKFEPSTIMIIKLRHFFENNLIQRILFTYQELYSQHILVNDATVRVNLFKQRQTSKIYHYKLVKMSYKLQSLFIFIIVIFINS